MHQLLVFAALVAASAATGALGAPKDVETLTKQQKEIVNFATVQLQGGEHGPCKRDTKVEQFKTQVVQGTLYKFDIILQQKKTSSAECLVKEGDEIAEVCHMVVWDKPWEKFREIQWEQVKCEKMVQNPKAQTASSSPVLPRVALSNEEAPLRVGLVIPPPGMLEALNEQPFLGGGDHDHLPHVKRINPKSPRGDEKPLIGSGDHDQLPHGKHLLGGGEHDKVHHGGGPMLGGKVAHGPKFDQEWTRKELLQKEESDIQLKKLQSLGAFHTFMSEHNKTYESKQEYKKRYAIFRDNMKKVQFLRETELGTGQYGATHLADISETEFKKNYLGWNKDKEDPEIHWPAAEIPDVQLPKLFDWRENGAVSEVKNQGQCGSCWAFSVTGNVEGQQAVKNGELLSLSEQELVDCDKRDGGCQGGLPENAYKTLLEIGGLELEEDYGYDGKDEQCLFNRSKVAVRVTGGVEISQNEDDMAKWLYKKGPISVGLNAAAMQFYRGGVSHPWKFLCSPDGIDHGVLIVGFGEHEYPLFHKMMPYWIIKNSWGTGWGEQGYYRLYRGDGTCGINMMTSSSVVE